MEIVQKQVDLKIPQINQNLSSHPRIIVLKFQKEYVKLLWKNSIYRKKMVHTTNANLIVNNKSEVSHSTPFILRVNNAQQFPGIPFFLN
jgi:hypothetical protein